MRRGKLTNISVANHGVGKFNDGDGLWLVKSSPTAGKWILRVSLDGRRREMGLGSIDRVTLAEAREKARAARNLAYDGTDPIRARAEKRREAASRKMTFAELVAHAFESRKADLKNDGDAGKWMSPLTTHVLPKLGRLDAEQVNQNDLVEVLQPIWHVNASVASKALDRIGITLLHGAALGLATDVTAKVKARAILGKQRHTVKHFESLPYPEAPEFWRTLVQDTSKSALALQLVMLTAARSGEVRGMRLDEIEGDVWTIPPERMKGGLAHSVALSPAALAVIAEASKITVNGFLFPGRDGSGPISDMTMNQWLKRRELEFKPHGFRSTFRTWVAERCPDVRDDIAEAALAHVTGSKVQRSYRRTDFIEERAVLMARWADFLTGGAA